MSWGSCAPSPLPPPALQSSCLWWGILSVSQWLRQWVRGAEGLHAPTHLVKCTCNTMVAFTDSSIFIIYRTGLSTCLRATLPLLHLLLPPLPLLLFPCCSKQPCLQ